MSSDWDFYMCKVEDVIASIFLDLGVAKLAPIPDFPNMSYIRIYMQSPRDDGLSSREEFDVLSKMEKTIEAATRESGGSIYVGRCTSDGCRDLYFYSGDANEWSTLIGRVMGEFHEYEYEIGGNPDPEWEAYFSFLYPSDEDRERIENRRTCNALKENGDAFSEARPIDHWAYFKDASARDAFIQEAMSLGCSLGEKVDPEDPDSEFGVRVTNVGIPSEQNINDLTIPLFRAAKECGGEYDGWATSVVR